MQAEISGLANASALPVKFVQGIQMLYELQTIMVPIVNFSHAAAENLHLPGGVGAYNHTFPWGVNAPRGWEAKCARTRARRASKKGVAAQSKCAS